MCPFGLGFCCICICNFHASFFFSFLSFFVFTRFGVCGYCSLNSSRKCWLFHSEQCIRALFTNHKFHFSTTFSLQMGLIALFTYLKIILLFSVFNFQFQQNKFYPNRPISDYIMQFSISKHIYIIWSNHYTTLSVLLFCLYIN